MTEQELQSWVGRGLAVGIKGFDDVPQGNRAFNFVVKFSNELYPDLILGLYNISKNGQFGFITTLEAKDAFLYGHQELNNLPVVAFGRETEKGLKAVKAFNLYDFKFKPEHLELADQIMEDIDINEKHIAEEEERRRLEYEERLRKQREKDLAIEEKYGFLVRPEPIHRSTGYASPNQYILSLPKEMSLSDVLQYLQDIDFKITLENNDPYDDGGYDTVLPIDDSNISKVRSDDFEYRGLLWSFEHNSEAIKQAPSQNFLILSRPSYHS